MHITLRQLEVFAEIAKSGSTTGVGHAVIIAVRAALTDPGKVGLGVQLFDRVGSGWWSTNTGACLYFPRWHCWASGEIEQLFH